MYNNQMWIRTCYELMTQYETRRRCTAHHNGRPVWSRNYTIEARKCLMDAFATEGQELSLAEQ